MALSENIGFVSERAVHMSGALTAQKNVETNNKVSPLLETVCANRLDSSLHPALRQIVNWLAVVKPNPFVSIAELIDEVYLITSSLLHYHYLQHSTGGGSFGEQFYGLSRSKLDGSAMTDQDKVRSLLWLTAVPYVLTKLAKKLDAYRLQLADGVLFNNLERRSKQLVCYLCGTANALLAYFRVFQLTIGGGTPELHFQKLSLQPSSIETEPPVTIQAFAFAAQLATAINSQNLSSFHNYNYLNSQNQIIPPPKYDSRSEEYLGKCALCLAKPPVSPTAVATTGYVYCFSCIMHHVQANKEAKCPVARVPISLQHLVRIYNTNPT